jgi:hypothetical protein
MAERNRPALPRLFRRRLALKSALNGECLPLGLEFRRTRRRVLNRLLVWGVASALLIGVVGVLVATAEQTKGPVFIAADQPVTEDQLRQKLQSEGYSNLQMLRQGRYIEAMGSKDGQTGRVTVDAQTGRLRADDDDDDDDD